MKMCLGRKGSKGTAEVFCSAQVISKYSQGVQPGDLGWNPTAPVSSPRPKWRASQKSLGVDVGEGRAGMSVEFEVWSHLHGCIPARGAFVCAL